MTEELPQRDPEEYGFDQDCTTVYDKIREEKNNSDFNDGNIFDYEEKV